MGVEVLTVTEVKVINCDFKGSVDASHKDLEVIDGFYSTFSYIFL
jgi:hypothetical protein